MTIIIIIIIIVIIAVVTVVTCDDEEEEEECRLPVTAGFIDSCSSQNTIYISLLQSIVAAVPHSIQKVLI
jgi:hypothetical protein